MARAAARSSFCSLAKPSSRRRPVAARPACFCRPVHSYETSLPSLTTSLIINCISERLNAMALFSAARSTRAPIPDVDRRTSRGGVAQLGVSRRGCGFVVCASRFSVAAAWCEEAPDGGSFSCFSRESPPRARRDRRLDLCDGFCRSAGLRPPEFHFGHFASREWRLLAVGCHQKKVRFLLRCARA